MSALPYTRQSMLRIAKQMHSRHTSDGLISQITIQYKRNDATLAIEQLKTFTNEWVLVY